MCFVCFHKQHTMSNVIERPYLWITFKPICYHHECTRLLILWSFRSMVPERPSIDLAKQIIGNNRRFLKSEATISIVLAYSSQPRHWGDPSTNKYIDTELKSKWSMRARVSNIDMQSSLTRAFRNTSGFMWINTPLMRTRSYCRIGAKSKMELIKNPRS